MRRIHPSLYLILVMTLFCTMPVSAKPSAQFDLTTRIDVDTKWLAWTGCWQFVEEHLEPTAELNSQALDQTFVCLSPTKNRESVAIAVEANGKFLTNRTLVADGSKRTVTDNDCRGWENRSWSIDGRRLFTQAELTCGNEPLRRVNGISLFTSSGTWIDIQLIDTGDQQHLELRRYNAVAGKKRTTLLGYAALKPRETRAVIAARNVNTESLTVNDVLEATQQIDPRVVEALLTETQPRLYLNREVLIALDDAKVHSSVIDLLVALAYPDEFVVERQISTNRGNQFILERRIQQAGGSTTYQYYNFYDRPIARSYYYDPIWYGDLYPYYVTPFGYGSWRTSYSPYFYGRSRNPYVRFRGDTPRWRRQGRAVPPRSYTRVRERETTVIAPQQSGGRSRGTPSDSGSNGKAGSRSDGKERGTPGGYTRGGRGGNTGSRRAVPRN